MYLFNKDFIYNLMEGSPNLRELDTFFPEIKSHILIHKCKPIIIFDFLHIKGDFIYLTLELCLGHLYGSDP